MSDQSLRDALKELADERDSVSGHAASDYHIRPYELYELLAAHPAEPAPVPGRASAFEVLLAAPYEQFDKRSELLASIEAYSKAIPATASAAPPRQPASTVVHPAEPAPVVTDEAVEAVAGHFYTMSSGIAWSQIDPHSSVALNYKRWAAEALEAAAPLLGPRPMPTIDEVAYALFEHDSETTGRATPWGELGAIMKATYLDRGEAVLALLNGAES